MNEEEEEEEEEEQTQSSRCLFAFLENSPISEWLLNADAEAENRVAGFFGEASRYSLDHAYWLQENQSEDEDEEEMEEEEEDGWEKWLHPASKTTDSDGADLAFFSEYMRFLRQSSSEEWMKEAPVVAAVVAPIAASAAAPAAEPVIPTPIGSTNFAEAMASTTSSRRSSIIKKPSFTSESWLMTTPLSWHKNHQHHYGECVESCRALPDNVVQMEIENLGNLSCLADFPTTTTSFSKADQEDALSQWILKPKKGKVIAGKSRKNQQTAAVSEWLLEAPVETTTTKTTNKNHFDVTEWLNTTEKELVKELCKANEPCSGFEGCLSDINCKKSKKTDDEEKEKEDEKKEKGEF